ncbi:MAG: response regulator transcription factor [Actinobacteria bacterium]|nr:response regulator transcription factor [Actinomycetota bacterium]
MIEVFVLDDHPVVRQGIRKILDGEADISLAGEAATFQELLGLLDDKAPDVLVLDITLPGSSGLDVLKELKAQYPDIKVLILTIHKEEHFALRTLKAGADGFLNKMSVSDELVQALRKIAGGGKYVSTRVAELLAAGLDERSSGMSHENLSDREFQVLLRISRGMKLNDIAEELCLSPKTIGTYRERLLEKMNMRTNTELTYYAVKNGLID